MNDPRERSLVQAMFPTSMREALEAELMRYPETARESARVRQAVLVLSAGSLDELKHYVDAALEDYRDVLFWAEYPDESTD